MARPVPPEVLSRPIRELGLAIEGSRLEPIAREFHEELRTLGLDRLQPRLYLSTEWGVPDGTRAIAIPFYLASEDLTALHAERAGHVEGRDPADILRYLRHEMGHVVNYLYRLHESREWSDLFGPMAQPYIEEYRPVPFSRDFVRHLPGWYAQKHPDEDWAETFAVWMTPFHDWRSEYATWAVALRKLEYCDRIMGVVSSREPFDTSEELDEDVSEIGFSLDEFYASHGLGFIRPEGLDSALRSMFDRPNTSTGQPVSSLIRRHAPEVAAEVFRWTGRFPEWTMPLLRSMAERADAAGLACAGEDDPASLIRLAIYVASLASHDEQNRCQFDK